MSVKPLDGDDDASAPPLDLLSQVAVDPELHASGFPLEQMAGPTCQVPLHLRKGFLPGLVQRGSADAGPLLALLAQEEADEVGRLKKLLLSLIMMPP